MSSEDPSDPDIDRESARMIAGEQEDAVGYLAADAGEFHKLSARGA
jgi:hypothetical protein